MKLDSFEQLLDEIHLKISDFCDSEASTPEEIKYTLYLVASNMLGDIVLNQNAGSSLETMEDNIDGIASATKVLIRRYYIEKQINNVCDNV